MAEDHLAYVGFLAQELRTAYGHEVLLLDDPFEAEAELQRNRYDAVIADILFDEMLEQFSERAPQRTNILTSDRLIRSGLSIMKAAQSAGTGVIVWTAGDAYRKLHMAFAYQELGVRAFCSKRSAAGAQGLHDALNSVAAGNDSIDVIIGAALPSPHSVGLRQTLLSKPTSKRAIWRALAVGSRSREAVKALTGFETSTIGDLVRNMHDDLQALGMRLQTSASTLDERAKFNECLSFAEFYAQFFLDDTVRAMYP